MKKYQKLLLGMVLCAAAFFSVKSIQAYFTDTVKVKNLVRTGVVDIHIEEWKKDETGQEIPYEDPKTVVPGQRISKIVRIVNDKADAYIRAKVDFGFEGAESGLNIQDLEGVDEKKWVYLGGYFYFREPVPGMGVIDLFEGVRIPEQWDNAYSNGLFTINITAEAVQAEHMTPDYSSETPWGEIEIEACVYPEETEKDGEASGTARGLESVQESETGVR